jgi:hypothetical protein
MRWLTTGTLAPAFRSCPSLSLSKLRLVGWRWIEGGFDRIVDALEPYEPDLVAGFFAHVLEVLAVARGSMTVEILAWIAASTSSFTPADWKQQAARRDLAGHGGIAPHRASSDSP